MGLLKLKEKGNKKKSYVGNKVSENQPISVSTIQYKGEIPEQASPCGQPGLSPRLPKLIGF